MSTISSVTPTWDAGTGGTPATYNLRWRVQGVTSWTTITGITDTFYVISGLTVNQTIEWEVQAVNGGGTSAWSATTTCTTASDCIEWSSANALCGWRGQVGINWLGKAIVGDKYSPVLGFSDFNSYTEYGNPLIMTVTTPTIQDDRKRVFLPRFELDMQVGGGGDCDPNAPPHAILRVSKDGGMTWGNNIYARSMGKVGEYLTRLRWLNLGQSRATVLKVTIADPVRRTIIGAYLDTYTGYG